LRRSQTLKHPSSLPDASRYATFLHHNIHIHAVNPCPLPSLVFAGLYAFDPPPTGPSRDVSL
jgi:hypothetical protein